jgi:hypothetical protein
MALITGVRSTGFIDLLERQLDDIRNKQQLSLSESAARKQCRRAEDRTGSDSWAAYTRGDSRGQA